MASRGIPCRGLQLRAGRDLRRPAAALHGPQQSHAGCAAREAGPGARPRRWLADGEAARPATAVRLGGVLAVRHEHRPPAARVQVLGRGVAAVPSSRLMRLAFQPGACGRQRPLQPC